MLRVRTRGATRLSWSTMKVRKLELTGIRTSSNSSWRAPTGSRLSCGRPARRRKGVGRRPCPIRGTTLGFPQKRSPPAGVKRLLGGLGGTIEEVYDTGPQTVLGSDDQQPVALDQALEDGGPVTQMVDAARMFARTACARRASGCFRRGE